MTDAPAPREDPQVDKAAPVFERRKLGTGPDDPETLHRQLALGNIQTARHYLEDALTAAERALEVQAGTDAHTERVMTKELVTCVEILGTLSRIALAYPVLVVDPRG